jgi:hypothetical protein
MPSYKGENTGPRRGLVEAVIIPVHHGLDRVICDVLPVPNECQLLMNVGASLG